MAGQQQHTGADNVDDAGIADHPAVPREPVGLRLVAADALPLRKHMKNKKSVDGPDDGPDDDLLRSGGVVQQRGGKRCLRQGQREDRHRGAGLRVQRGAKVVPFNGRSGEGPSRSEEEYPASRQGVVIPSCFPGFSGAAIQSEGEKERGDAREGPYCCVDDGGRVLDGGGLAHVGWAARSQMGEVGPARL
ncbi:unnamed protein product [Clonostachys rosea f. rosea IK726]|uniref:Uncharacterized protein n=1 Tax=Clonostachys rosea f. rosea IK726 TaxID=1349383 RepID=A0ACA9U3D8_BIOOC|nr:unnamed protein product [Clonostachys rosea f. rosea IK726]